MNINKWGDKYMGKAKHTYERLITGGLKQKGEKGWFWLKNGLKVVFLAIWAVLGVFGEKWWKMVKIGQIYVKKSNFWRFLKKFKKKF